MMSPIPESRIEKSPIEKGGFPKPSGILIILRKIRPNPRRIVTFRWAGINGDIFSFRDWKYKMRQEKIQRHNALIIKSVIRVARKKDPIEIATRAIHAFARSLGGISGIP